MLTFARNVEIIFFICVIGSGPYLNRMGTGSLMNSCASESLSAITRVATEDA